MCDSKEELVVKNVEIFGISLDFVKCLLKFVDKESLNFILFLDEDYVVVDVFGVWGLKKFMGKEYDGIYCISFMIDENGIIE